MTKNEYLLNTWVGDPKDKRRAPKFGVPETIGFLKGKCDIKVFDKHLELKKRFWGRHLWAKGYCVSTVGLDEEKIWKHVKW